MQPSTRPNTLWCVMWSLCELGELVCEPPMEPEPRLTREKQDWSWEEGRGATGGRSGSPGMWIHYKYITITTTSNHCSGAGEEGPNIFCKYCYQISTKIMRITLDTFLFSSYQIIQKCCRVPPIRICTLPVATWVPNWNSLNIGVAPPLAWCSQCSGQYNTVTLSHGDDQLCLSANGDLDLMTPAARSFVHLLCQIGCINDRAVKTKKVSFSAWSDFILRLRTT